MPSQRTELEKKTDARNRADAGSRTEIAREVIESICDDLEVICLNAFKQSHVQDIEGHQNCRLYLELLSDIKQVMLSRIETGVQAQEMLKALPSDLN